MFDSSKNYAYLSSVNNNSYRVYIDGDVIKFNYDNYNKTQQGIYDYVNQCWLEYDNALKYNYIDLTQLYTSIDLSKTNLNRDLNGKVVCYVYDQYYQFP